MRTKEKGRVNGFQHEWQMNKISWTRKLISTKVLWVDLGSPVKKAVWRATVDRIATHKNPATQVHIVQKRVVGYCRRMIEGCHPNECVFEYTDLLCNAMQEMAKCQPAGVIAIVRLHKKELTPMFCESTKYCPWCHYRQSLKLANQVAAITGPVHVLAPTPHGTASTATPSGTFTRGSGRWTGSIAAACASRATETSR